MSHASIATRWRPILVLISAVATGCWSQSIAREIESVEIDRPGSAPMPGGARGGAASETGKAAAMSSTGVEPLDEPTWSPAPTAHQVLDNGIAVFVRGGRSTVHSSPTVLLRLAVQAGTATDPAGAAELAAAVLIGGPSTGGGPPLRRRIAALGGTVTARVDRSSTAFDVIVPQQTWTQALDALVTALAAGPAAGAHVDRIRYRWLRDRREELARPSLDALVARVTRHAGAAPTQQIIAVEDRTWQELEQLVSRHYRPAGAVLALSIPVPTPQEALDRAAECLHPWQSGAEPVRASAATPLDERARDILWATVEREVCAFALVIPEPLAATPGGLQALTLLECLGFGGIGESIGVRLDARLGSLRILPVWSSRARYSVLAGSAPPEQIAEVWRAHAAARERLAATPPSEPELSQARQRVRLRLLAEHRDPRCWLENATCRGLSGLGQLDLDAALEQLAGPPPTAAVAPAIADLPVQLVVLGPLPDSGPPAHVTVLPAPFLPTAEPALPAERNAQAVAADAWLEIAVRAAGGAARLRQITGWAASGSRRSRSGAEILEHQWYAAAAPAAGGGAGGVYRRVRRILATEIETLVAGERRLERAGAETVELGREAANTLLERAASHPLLLLARYARGEIRFRLVSLRARDHRELALVEQLGTDHPLRLALDVRSGLVRTVTRRAWQPDQGAWMRVIAEYGDYRACAGIRVPHWERITIAGDPARVVTASWDVFEPGVPDPVYLEAGGPVEIAPRR